MRSWNVARNAFAGIICQILTIVLGFAVRTVFTKTLDSEYLGLVSVYTSILDILNLSELGLASAVIFALYKPLAEKDYVKISILIQFLRKSYRYISGVFLILGLILLPFLPNLIQSRIPFIHIYIIYLIYLTQTILSYNFFAYKIVMLNADQKERVVSYITTIANIVKSVLQIIVLLYLHEDQCVAFYLFVIISLISTLGINYVASTIVDKKYMFINNIQQEGLPQNEKDSILKNVVALAIYRVGCTLNNSIGNVILSAYISLNVVGIYSNYVLIMSSISGIIGKLFSSFNASIGNFNVTESLERKEFLFYSVHMLYFWICGELGIIMWILLNPFIGGIWLNKNWIFEDDIITALVLKFLIDSLLGAVIRFREASGLFWNSRYRYVATILVNIAVSVCLISIYDMGIWSIILGIIAGQMILLAVDPFIVFKNVFNKYPFKFYWRYFYYFFIVIVTALVVQKICSLWDMYTVTGFFIGLIICLIVPNVLWYILFHRTDEYQYIESIAKNIITRKILRK